MNNNLQPEEKTKGLEPTAALSSALVSVLASAASALGSGTPVLLSDGEKVTVGVRVEGERSASLIADGAFAWRFAGPSHVTAHLKLGGWEPGEPGVFMEFFAQKKIAIPDKMKDAWKGERVLLTQLLQ